MSTGWRTTVTRGSRRGGHSRALLALVLVAGVMAGTAALHVAPAGSALPPPPPGCGFTLVSEGYLGAAGSEYLSARAVPVSSFERCTTTVSATGSLTPDDGVAYTNVADNPVTQPLTLTFAPSMLMPVVLLQFTLHCADPASPGTLRLSVAGQTIVQAVAAQSCNGATWAGLSIGLEPNSSYTGIASTPDGGGYVGIVDQGDVFTEGNGAPSPTVTDPTGTAIASAPSGAGYWVAGTDGSVYSYGSAGFHGSAYGLHLNDPVVGIASTPDGGGYWLVASDGGVFAYGSAGFFGSMGGHPLNAPVVGIAGTPGGKGYWLVAADGGVFSFGDAAFDGSAGSLLLNAPVTGIAADPHGGYWLAATDGGVFAYGAAGFFGSAATLHLAAPVSAITPAPDGAGYALLGADGGIFAYGSAGFFGSPNT